MSRAFTPPSSMSKSDILAVADVRRAVWTGGFTGLATGLCFGTSAHLALVPLSKFLNIDLTRKPRTGEISIVEDLIRSSKPLCKNHRILYALFAGAVVSYLGAVTAGTNNRFRMQHVYGIGAHEKLTPYEQVRKGKTARVNFGEEEEFERQLHDENVRERAGQSS